MEAPTEIIPQRAAKNRMNLDISSSFIIKSPLKYRELQQND
jgi:hypothetical protein